MLVRAPYILPFVLVMQNVFEREETRDNRDNAVTRSYTKRNAAPMGVALDKYSAKMAANLNDDRRRKKSRVMIENQNVNVNIIGRHRGERLKQPDNLTPVTMMHDLNVVAKEDQSMNCASGKKKNQRYSSSFVGNTTGQGLNVDEEFNEVIGNNSKEKKTSSVHVGEDITLCWIETTTIKEDKTSRPPKRLVIREYTISFENSATIPDRYLECNRLEGELATNDPDVGKTALFEIIDEDTKVSRVVNFTTVSHIGDVLVWQHKRVKCGVGPVISKNIIEWTDDTKNPKKRVEIKVSPKMRHPTATKTEEKPCTEEIEENSTQSNCRNNFTESCENGDICEITIESGGSSTKRAEVSTTEETIIEVPRSEASAENCGEDSSDPACIMQGDTSPPVELSITEAAAKNEASTTTSMNTEMTSKIPSVAGNVDMEKVISSEENLSVTDESSSNLSEENISSTISGLVTKEIIPFTSKTGISIESSETTTVPGDSYTDHDAATVLGTKATTSTSVMDIEKGGESSELTKESSTDISATTEVLVEETSEESNGDSSFTEELMEGHRTIIPIDSTSKESDKVDHVPSSGLSTIASGETNFEREITSVTPPFESIESAEESGGSDDILNKLSETSSVSIDSVTTEFSLISEEVPSRGNGETVVSATGATTIGLETASDAEFTPIISTNEPSLPKIEPISLSTTTNGEVDYLCENSENCAYVSSSEVCDEFGNCGRVTTKSCESGECSEEGVDEDHSMSEATLSTTTETQSSAIKMQSSGAHKLTLKIKVLLEHVNEKKEKENLVEVEKHLPLNINMEHREHPDLIEQLKSLNNSINMETISALLNCTSLSKLAKDSNFIGKRPNDTVDDNLERLVFQRSGGSIPQQHDSEHFHTKHENSRYSKSNQERESHRERRSFDVNDKIGDLNRLVTVRENISDPNNSLASDSDDSSTILEYQNANSIKQNIQSVTRASNFEEETSNAVYTEKDKDMIERKNESEVLSVMENIGNETKTELARQTLSGIQEDVSVGLQHVVSQLARGNLTSVGGTKKTNIDLLDVIANPEDSRIHSRRRREATEEVGRWSNERIREAPMGGSLRSLTEFTLYKVLS